VSQKLLNSAAISSFLLLDRHKISSQILLPSFNQRFLRIKAPRYAACEIFLFNKPPVLNQHDVQFSTGGFTFTVSAGIISPLSIFAELRVVQRYPYVFFRFDLFRFFRRRFRSRRIVLRVLRLVRGGFRFGGELELADHFP